MTRETKVVGTIEVRLTGSDIARYIRQMIKDEQWTLLDKSFPGLTVSQIQQLDSLSVDVSDPEPFTLTITEDEAPF